MGWTTDLVVGLAEYIEAAGIGTYEATAPYDPASTTPVIVHQALPDLPGKAIALAYFSSGGTANVNAAVQVLIRGDADPTSPDEIADALWTLLDNAAGRTLGGIPVVLMWRQTSASLGLDSAGRWMRSDTYLLIADRPSANWPD
jgi:hypothetical protein